MRIEASFDIWGDDRLHFRDIKISYNPPSKTVDGTESSVRIHSSLIGWVLSLIGKSVEMVDPKSKERKYVNVNSLRKWVDPFLNEQEKSNKPLPLSKIKEVVDGWVKTHQQNISFEEVMKIAEEQKANGQKAN